MESLGIWWMWAGFAGIILLLLLVDLIFVGGGVTVHPSPIDSRM